MAGLVEGFSTGFGLGLRKKQMDQEQEERQRRIEREARLDKQSTSQWQADYSIRRENADRAALQAINEEGRAEAAERRAKSAEDRAVETYDYERKTGRAQKEESHKAGLAATKAATAASQASAAAAAARAKRDEAEYETTLALRKLNADRVRLGDYDEEFSRNPAAMDNALQAAAMLEGQAQPDMGVILKAANLAGKQELMKGTGVIDSGQYKGWTREPATIVDANLNPKDDNYGTIKVNVPIVSPTGERKILTGEPITLKRSLDEDDGIAEIDFGKYKQAIIQQANVAMLAKKHGIPPSRVARELDAKIVEKGGDPNALARTSKDLVWDATRGILIDKVRGTAKQVAEPTRMGATDAALERFKQTLIQEDYDPLSPEFARLVEAKRAELGAGKPALGNSTPTVDSVSKMSDEEVLKAAGLK